ATLVSMALGVPLGLFAGYRRGALDELIMRLLDIMMSFPPILLVLLILVVMVEASLRMVFAVLMGAVLSFLGFGVQPPAADWGLMISSGRSFVDIAPWISLAPGLAMSLTVIAISLLGDGLREVLDPRVRGRL